MHPRDQTIFALSSGRAPSAIAVVRVSGPQASAVLTALAGRLPAPRQASRRLLRDGAGEPIDDAVVLWFPGPGSATGEDVAEFHVHGGRAVLAALFAAISLIPSSRTAEPGEFTRRAFENGKLDLTEAEGLDDLIHADTDRQRRQALRQLEGLLGNRARDWRERIIEASALIEAGIDFSDEGDVPAALMAPAVHAIGALHDEIAKVLAAQGHSERLRDGIVVAIAGEPNVGKSTLMNQLARREVAIVSPHAGTTRDVIEVQLDLDGYPVTVIDTAGIRETSDPVEQEGVRRARARAEDADLVLWLVEAEQVVDPDAMRSLRKSGDDHQSGGPVWIVRNKIDLGFEPRSSGEFAISASRGDGIPAMVDALIKFAAEFFGTSEGALVTRARQRELLGQARDSLRRSLELVEEGEELAAEELRSAAYALGRLLGRVDVEDVLGAIFQKFCIGK
ncbi:tRNA uridine-5-carboxymethylaminomethyl(34) synthesis GTPase MnmE [Bradyrhizobium sp. SEMIA]|uniref:tRNA uridine-5-carboxymethylaminomethyl(34) synthesis GTPase MnmE n=1 Tax=Bradyrhizobium sp. SEMIA TaxID=2597515 RepID=UPI0018A40F7F|nr:tRNA uridine-5-carboxymethylaminomethyl(34) synthesis GTPase MnmE [Bradyrhizobium sp. SEMIA]QOG16071.1 tRNA uridine-5-carboxymethylaminomethyl(34) synthesis GTPase MnmE [Bradyrhizobium sp. SEMIA]